MTQCHEFNGNQPVTFVIESIMMEIKNITLDLFIEHTFIQIKKSIEQIKKRDFPDLNLNSVSFDVCVDSFGDTESANNKHKISLNLSLNKKNEIDGRN